MMKQVSVALAAGLLMAGVSAAAAAAMPSSSAKKMAPPASHALRLTATQQKTAWNDLHRQAGRQIAPSSFRAAVGQAVPSGVTIKPVTAKAASDVPSLRRYDFAMVKGKLLIVNPTNKKIAQVING